MTTGIAWVVAGRILKPVRLVRTTAAQLTEQDLTRRIPVHGHDDVAALAETFNAMLDRLERAFATSAGSSTTPATSCAPRSPSCAAHLELMGDDPAEREETVRLVTEELDRMSRIVEDLLLLAKAELPDFVTPEPVQLGRTHRRRLRQARTLGDREWVLDGVADRRPSWTPSASPRPWCSSRRTPCSTPPPARPSASAPAPTAPVSRLYVADSGPGVQPQDAEVVFEAVSGAARHGAVCAARAPGSDCRSSRRSPRATAAGSACAPPRRRRRHPLVLTLEEARPEPHPHRRGRGASPSFVEKGLRANGFTTPPSPTAAPPTSAALTGGFDLVVLDIRTARPGRLHGPAGAARVPGDDPGDRADRRDSRDTGGRPGGRRRRLDDQAVPLEELRRPSTAAAAYGGQGTGGDGAQVRRPLPDLRTRRARAAGARRSI